MVRYEKVLRISSSLKDDSLSAAVERTRFAAGSISALSAWLRFDMVWSRN